MACDLPLDRFDPIAQALRDVSARLAATLPICETMPGEDYVCSGCPAEDGDHCAIQEIRDILSRHPVRKDAAAAVCACDGPCRLADVPTCDLVKELATREGVTEHVARPHDQYLVKTKVYDGVSRADFGLGPAIILVVVD